MRAARSLFVFSCSSTIFLRCPLTPNMEKGMAIQRTSTTPVAVSMKMTSAAIKTSGESITGRCKFPPFPSLPGPCDNERHLVPGGRLLTGLLHVLYGRHPFVQLVLAEDDGVVGPEPVRPLHPGLQCPAREIFDHPYPGPSPGGDQLTAFFLGINP